MARTSCQQSTCPRNLHASRHEVPAHQTPLSSTQLGRKCCISETYRMRNNDITCRKYNSNDLTETYQLFSLRNPSNSKKSDPRLRVTFVAESLVVIAPNGLYKIQKTLQDSSLQGSLLPRGQPWWAPELSCVAASTRITF